MSVYKEIFEVRQSIHTLKDKLDKLNTVCKVKCNAAIHKEIKDTIENLRNLKTRLHILQMLSQKVVF